MKRTDETQYTPDEVAQAVAAGYELNASGWYVSPMFERADGGSYYGYSLDYLAACD